MNRTGSNRGEANRPETEPYPEHSEELRRELIDVARRSIVQGVEEGRLVSLDTRDISEPLLEPGAAFVSVYVDGLLRGCTGELRARQALAASVYENAYLAAFRDTRFPAITREELPRMSLQISVLSPQVPLEFESEEELLGQLQPLRDGLTIQLGRQRATFLPQVWESLPEPEQFLFHLKRKAGIPSGPVAGLEAWRYGAEVFGDKGSGHRKG